MVEPTNIASVTRPDGANGLSGETLTDSETLPMAAGMNPSHPIDTDGAYVPDNISFIAPMHFAARHIEPAVVPFVNAPPMKSRRNILRLGLMGAGAGILAACGGGGSSSTPTTSSGSGATATGASSTASPLANATTGGGPTAVTTAGTSAKTLTAMTAFLATLDATQKTAVVAERTQANLSQWSNLPDSAYKRAGLRMDTLSADQQKAALGILQAVLSPEGYTQVSEVTTADGVLLTQSNGGGGGFGADKYYIRAVGTPSATTPWTLQYGGHHLAVNVSILGTKMTMAPTLWGSQPSMYALNGKNVEPLGGEVAKAFALMNALDGTQQKDAILTSAMRDLALGAGQDGKTIAAAGVKASTFTNAQKQLMLALVQEWLRPLNAESVAARLALSETELDQTQFAWSGPTTVGQPIYYRVTTPTSIIEFAHQGNGTDAVQHIHSIYREIGNDYGAKLSA